jgi:hypothetical protein
VRRYVRSDWVQRVEIWSGYEKLVTEVDSWVDYREGKYN